MSVRVLLLSAVVCASIGAEEGLTPADAIVENYWAASEHQQSVVKSASMDVEMAASLPQLKKQGRLHALRRISALGRITYDKLRFEGDNTVKNQVIVRYLTAEAEAQKEQAPAMAVSPANYKFKYKGIVSLNERDTYLFEVTPKKKRAGLFKGDLWIDRATYLRVQESGYLVKNPSIFLKRVAFTRTFEIRGGLSVPRQVQSVVETRLVGRAELTIQFSNFSLEDEVASEENEGQ